LGCEWDDRFKLFEEEESFDTVSSDYLKIESDDGVLREKKYFKSVLDLFRIGMRVFLNLDYCCVL